jgi:hypothetical protein
MSTIKIIWIVPMSCRWIQAKCSDKENMYFFFQILISTHKNNPLYVWFFLSIQEYRFCWGKIAPFSLNDIFSLKHRSRIQLFSRVLLNVAEPRNGALKSSAADSADTAPLSSDSTSAGAGAAASTAPSATAAAPLWQISWPKKRRAVVILVVVGVGRGATDERPFPFLLSGGVGRF